MTIKIETISLQDARLIIEACEKKALEIKQPMHICIVDAGANRVAHIRMDGAWLGSADISYNKALTARLFDISTAELSKLSQPGDQFYGIRSSNDGRVMLLAGGYPLIKDGTVVGAVGVSGGTGEQDTKVAEAGKAAFEKHVK